MTDGLVRGAVDAPTVLGGRYRIDGLIGRGGMASVYKAFDEILGRHVAIKLFGGTADDDAHAARAATEVRVLASLNHHSLVTLFDAHLATDGEDYLVMELVDGPTLRDRIAAGPLDPDDIATMAADLAEALAAVHGAGMVHRDVKPSNVLLAPATHSSREFRAKLADFGIAHLIDSARLTTPGTIMGTAAYLSPEQTKGVTPAPPGDVYSLGLVLLESFTRERAFPGGMTESLVARVQRDPYVPGSVGYGWKSLLTAMTARAPENRPTAMEVAESARGLIGGTAPSAATVGDHVAAPITQTTAIEVPDDDRTSAAPVVTAPSRTDDAPTEGLRQRRRTSARATRSPHRRRRWAVAASAVVVAAGLGTGFASVMGANVRTASTEPGPALAGLTSLVGDFNAGFGDVVSARKAAADTEADTVVDGETAVDTTPTSPSPDDAAPAPEQEAPAEEIPAQETPAETGPSEGNGPGNGKGAGKGNESGTGPGSGGGKGKGNSGG